jgi:amino acid adenylation domain-containing protein
MLLNEFLERSAGLFPGKTALICRHQRLTFADIDHAANSLAHALVEEGFARQDRAVNSVASVVCIFAVLKAGGVFVIIDPQVKVKKLQYMLEDCQARILFTDAAHLAAVSGGVYHSAYLKHIVLTDDEPSVTDVVPPAGSPAVLSYPALLSQHPKAYPVPSCSDTDLASLIYTSGSSGKPKGVMLTHRNMVSAADSIIQYLENNENDVILDSLPLAFDYGLYQVLMAFKFGGTVVLEKAFVYPQQMINLIVRERVTGWPIVPMIAAILVRLKNLENHDFSSLRYITSTGQSLPPQHIVHLRKAFPRVKIYSMYGLTECKRVAYLPPEQLEKRPASVGKAMPNTEAYIVDNKGDVIKKSWQSGELVVRGPNVMKGYWNLPEETARALRPGPYPGERILFTGDLFQQDEEGFLYFLGRKDDIIKTAGHMVSPKEVENVLCEKEDVVEAAVVGVDDKILGNAVQAFVHLTDTSRSTAEDIIRFCSGRLEDFAVPKKVVLCGALPRTATGKIQKRELVGHSSQESE